MSNPNANSSELIISYMFLRKIIGWIGILLPTVLIAGEMIFFTTSLPESMSGYYYTPMRNILVGALCTLGVFLVGYVGYDKLDRWITNVAGVGAIGVAFFRTQPAVCAPGARVCLSPSVVRLSTGQQIVGGLHLFFAAVTFVALGLMALRFAKSQEMPQGQPMTTRLRHELGLARPSGDGLAAAKRKRNIIYRGCGVTIMSCVVLAALSNLLPASVKPAWPLMFIFEALAVFAFGVSWFVKGQTLLGFLKDPAPAKTSSQPVAGSLAGSTQAT